MSGLKDKHYISQAARANDKNKMLLYMPCLIMYYISDMYSYGNNNHISSLLSWGNLLCVLLIIYMMMSVIVSVVYDITICKFTSLWSCKLSAYDQTCFP